MRGNTLNLRGWEYELEQFIQPVAFPVCKPEIKQENVFLCLCSLAENSFGTILHIVLHVAFYRCSNRNTMGNVVVHADKREMAAVLSTTLVFISLKGCTTLQLKKRKAVITRPAFLLAVNTHMLWPLNLLQHDFPSIYFNFTESCDTQTSSPADTIPIEGLQENDKFNQLLLLAHL